MSRRQLLECDRCGALETDGGPERASWGRAYAATLGGEDRIGTAETAADLCGPCLDGLVKFMAGAVE